MKNHRSKIRVALRGRVDWSGRLPGVGAALATPSRGGGGGSRTRGRHWPGALGAVRRSGRASRRVPSLSNSRSHHRSEDLGVKVTRKKSYNVSTLPGRGCRPLPFTTYSAGLSPANRRAPSAQPAARVGQWAPPRPCPTWPPGPPLAPPPDQWPRGARRGRGWRRGGRPSRPRPCRGPFIRPRARNKGRAAGRVWDADSARRGVGAAAWERLEPAPGAARTRGLLEAAASRSARQSPCPAAGPRSGSSLRVVPAGDPAPECRVPARGGAEGEARISVTWPVPHRIPPPAHGRARFPRRTRLSGDVTRRPWLRPAPLAAAVSQQRRRAPCRPRPARGASPGGGGAGAAGPRG